ncbi:MAG: EthD family reductase [Bacteroidota bacterium]
MINQKRTDVIKKSIVLAFFVLSASISMAQEAQNSVSPRALPGWYKISISYPDGEGKHFDMDYYSKQHMPMVAALFGEKLKNYAIDKGVSGRTPDEPATYVAAGYFFFEKLSDYAEAFGPNAEKIRGDIPNYTNIQPIVQVSQIIK